MTDDYVQFYEKNEGDGAGQMATLAVIDMHRLMNSGFVETLDQLAQMMNAEATQTDSETGDYLFYDEFDSYKTSIQYSKGQHEYYDLGTLSAQLSYDFKELVPGDVIDEETIIDTNRYTETLDNISWILHNPEIIYAKGTSNIHSQSLRIRDEYGRESSQEVGTFSSLKSVNRQISATMYRP